VRDIQAHLEESYGVKVGHDLISRVTDAVLEDVRAWQSRPLQDVYPVLYLDALVVKIRDGGAVRRKACYVVMGVNLDGERDVLGLWFQATEGAEFWMSVLCVSSVGMTLQFGHAYTAPRTVPNSVARTVSC
jgi:putative transposase